LSALPTEIKVLGRTYQVPITTVDRIVNWFDPVRGHARFMGRAQMAISGGYTGARRDRKQTSTWRPGDGDADTVILPDLPTLRDRTRDLERNSPIAAGAISTKVTCVVGSGLTPHSCIDRDVLTGLTDDQADAWQRAAEREFRLATSGKDFDIERGHSFPSSQDLVFRSVLSAGDIFVNMPRRSRPGNPYTLRLNFIEADRVCNPQFKVDTPELVAGIGKDADGAPKEIHVAKFHPGNLRYTQKREWYPPIPIYNARGERQVLHIYRKLRPGQTRGVPDLAPVVEMLKSITNYTDSELHAAVVSSLFTVFVKSASGSPNIMMSGVNGTTQTQTQINTNGLELGSGNVLGLFPNEDITFADPKRPNTAAGEFLRNMAEQVGVAIELPYELLLKHFTASYSAARAALLEAWRFFLRSRAWLAEEYCQPIWEAVITEAVIRGRLAAPGFLADPLVRMAYLGCEWVGDSMGQIQPVQEVEAAALRVKEGFSTKAKETIALTGGDWERDEKQRAKEQKIEGPRIAARMATETPPAPPVPRDEKDDEADDKPDLEAA
jgi:lambda family phage portal protein